MGVQIPQWEGAISEEKGRPIVKCRDTLRWAVQKRLNRPKCHLIFRLCGPKETCIRWGAHGATWLISMNHPCERCSLVSNHFDYLLLWKSKVGLLVGWSLTSLFSTNTAISETNESRRTLLDEHEGQQWCVYLGFEYILRVTFTERQTFPWQSRSMWRDIRASLQYHKSRL